MSDLKKYIDNRKRKDKKFAENFDEGYEQFKLGVILRQARESSGLTQEDLGIKKKKRAMVYNDLDHLAGTWSDKDYREFSQATADFEKIDKKLWK